VLLRWRRQVVGAPLVDGFLLSEGRSQFSERDPASIMKVEIGGDLVVAAAQVLDEGVSG